MFISSSFVVLGVVIAAGIAMALYTMRRRVRLGRRKPTF
jgi:hypothetical protein